MGKRELQIMKNSKQIRESYMKIVIRQAKEIEELKLELSKMEERVFWLESQKGGGNCD